MNDSKSSPERCVICLDEKSSPVSIQCGHSFCCDCFNIYKSYKKFPWATKCPICRNVLRDKNKATKRKYSDRHLNTSGGRNTSRLEAENSSSSQSQSQSVAVQESNILEEFMALAANYLDDTREEIEGNNSFDYFETLNDDNYDHDDNYDDATYLEQENDTSNTQVSDRDADRDMSDSYEDEQSFSTDSDEYYDDDYYNAEYNNYYYFDEDDVSYQSAHNRSDTGSYYDSEAETSFVNDGVDQRFDNFDLDWETVIASDVIIVD